MHGKYGQWGYVGRLTLVSPCGQHRLTMQVPGRVRQCGDEGWELILSEEYYASYRGRRDAEAVLAAAQRSQRRFRRLLSRGWQPLGEEEASAPEPPEAKENARESAPKQTSKAKSDRKQSGQTKPGEQASGKDQDSPNPSQQGDDEQRRQAGQSADQESGPAGQQNGLGTGESGSQMTGANTGTSGPEQASGNSSQARERGGRGGRQRTPTGERRRTEQRQPRAPEVRRCAQRSGGAVYCPQPFRVTPDMERSAEKSARLLAELVGRSQLILRQGTTVDVEALLMALELGDNPIPPLEVPQERPQCRILITPDCSGSCQGWSGLSRAWATHLSRLPDVEVSYFQNCNGEFWDAQLSSAWRQRLAEVDFLIYLGDGDGHSLCHAYARTGCTILALDCHCANVAKPRLEVTPVGNGTVYWVDRVSASCPSTWYDAIACCLERYA